MLVCVCVCVCVCVFWVRSLRVSQQESLIQFSFHGDSGGTICPFFFSFFFFFFFLNKRGRRQIHCGSFCHFLLLNHYLNKAITWQTSQNRQTGPAEPPPRPTQHISALKTEETTKSQHQKMDRRCWMFHSFWNILIFNFFYLFFRPLASIISLYRHATLLLPLQ